MSEEMRLEHGALGTILSTTGEPIAVGTTLSFAPWGRYGCFERAYKSKWKKLNEEKQKCCTYVSCLVLYCRVTSNPPLVKGRFQASRGRALERTWAAPSATYRLLLRGDNDMCGCRRRLTSLAILSASLFARSVFAGVTDRIIAFGLLMYCMHMPRICSSMSAG